MKKSASRILTAVSAATVFSVLAVVGVSVANAAVTADRQAASEKIMTAAAPAYLGAADYSNTLDALNVASVAAKKAADEAAAEAARVAAEQAAAAEAARVAAEAEAQRVAAEQAAAEQDAPSADDVTGDEPPAADPIRCPAGTTAGAVDDAGNESNCQATGTDGQPCVEYNDANECVAWYKP